MTIYLYFSGSNSRVVLLPSPHFCCFVCAEGTEFLVLWDQELLSAWVTSVGAGGGEAATPHPVGHPGSLQPFNRELQGSVTDKTKIIAITDFHRAALSLEGVITELSRLEETCKFIQSLWQPSTIIITLKPCPQVPHPDGSWTLPETPPTPWAIYSNAWSLCQWISLPVSNLNLPWWHFRPSPPVLSLETGQRRQSPAHCSLLSGSCRCLWVFHDHNWDKVIWYNWDKVMSQLR